MSDDDKGFYLELLHAYLDSANDAIFTLCDEEKFLLCNRLTEVWLGEKEEELTRHNQRVPITGLLGEDASVQVFKQNYQLAMTGRPARFECLINPPKGEARWIELSMNKVDVEAGLMVIAVARDISERKSQQAILQYQLMHDDLTGLPNRTTLLRNLHQSVEKSKVRPIGLIVMDLDHFKLINDTLGHHFGDLLLVQVSLRLAEVIHDRGLLVRLGGDEFGVLLEGDSLTETYDVAVAIRQSLDELFSLPARLVDESANDEELVFDLNASLGVAVYPLHGEDPLTLIRHAEVAMYHAKELKRGIEVYSESSDEHDRERLALLGELRAAISSDQLVLYYQPKMNLLEGDLVGVECLVRWQHPKHGLMPPSAFIPQAEQTGLILPLTRWVLREAVRQCAIWQKSGQHVPVSVNLSMHNLLESDLASYIRKLLQEFELEAYCLQLEITESVMMLDSHQANALLKELHDMGVALSIDDFGTGYSSLAYLKHLPLSELKIDKSFVMKMTDEKENLAIVRGVTDLGHNLGFKVVAEGVERQQDHDRLLELGCDVVQGYLLSKPLAVDELNSWLLAQQKKSGR